MSTKVRQAAVLDEDPAVVAGHVVVGQVDAREQVDPGADGGALGGLQARVRVAGQGQEIAVRAPPTSESTGKVLQRAEAVTRAQQDLCRSDGSRGEYHNLADDLALATSRSVIEFEVIHPPCTVGPLLDVGDH